MSLYIALWIIALQFLKTLKSWHNISTGLEIFAGQLNFVKDQSNNT